MRDCENCKHYVEKVEVGKGSSPEHYFGCDSWECEFKPTTKNDLGVDLISREQALVAIRNLYPGMPRVDFSGSLRKWVDKYKPYIECDDAIKQLPSVTPQEPKTGEWIEHFDESGKWYECDQCHTDWGGAVNFCPNCGADMREVE